MGPPAVTAFAGENLKAQRLRGGRECRQWGEGKIASLSPKHIRFRLDPGRYGERRKLS